MRPLCHTIFLACCTLQLVFQTTDSRFLSPPSLLLTGARPLCHCHSLSSLYRCLLHRPAASFNLWFCPLSYNPFGLLYSTAPTPNNWQQNFKPSNIDMCETALSLSSIIISLPVTLTCSLFFNYYLPVVWDQSCCSISSWIPKARKWHHLHQMVTVSCTVQFPH